MEIPITGFIVHSHGKELEEEHSHVLYLTSWDGRPVHSHHFSGVTSFNVGHDHRFAGITDPAPSGVPHTHQYYTVTSFDDGHEHEIRGVTGPAIPLPNGGHYHNFRGVTSVNGAHPHSHEYGGETKLS